MRERETETERDRERDRDRERERQRQREGGGRKTVNSCGFNKQALLYEFYISFESLTHNIRLS